MKQINIIVPVYNEAKRLPSTLSGYKSYQGTLKDCQLKLVLVNDSSQDDSLAIMQEFASSNEHVQIVDLAVNQGKGGALKRGILASGEADYYYLADADGSAEWSVLTEFLENIGNARAIIGSRAVATSQVETVWYRKLLGRLSAFLIQLVLGLGIKDTQCGYKLFDNSLYRMINLVQETRWSFDFELLYIYKLAELSVKEYGIKWQNMPGSKVKFLDYFKQLPALVKIRLRHNVHEVNSVLA